MAVVLEELLQGGAGCGAARNVCLLSGAQMWLRAGTTAMGLSDTCVGIGGALGFHSPGTQSGPSPAMDGCVQPDENIYIHGEALIKENLA